MLCLALMTGCTSGKEVSKGGEFLLASEYWYHFDEVRGEYEKMRFDEDFSFYWGCVCGEPVGDSDCYEKYAYDEETSTIRLYNDYDDMAMEIEVMDYSDDHILLRMDGEIKDYTNREMELDIVDAEIYIDGYSGAFSMLDGNEQEIVLGPYDYDGDVMYPENAVKTYAFAEDVETYSLFAYTHIKDGQITESTVDYEAIQISEALEHIEYGSGGFVWFDEQMHVSKIMIYGKLVVEE